MKWGQFANRPDCGDIFPGLREGWWCPRWAARKVMEFDATPVAYSGFADWVTHYSITRPGHLCGQTQSWESIMLRPFEDYLDRLQELHAEMERAVEGLTLEALDWSPGPHMNSLCVLVVHVTGAERYWIGDVVRQDPSGRDREAEFRAHGMDATTLKTRLDGTLVYIRGVLDELTLQDLETPRISPRNERQFTVAWSLAHVLEHTAMHVGHAQITRQLWDQRQEVY